MLKIYQSVFVTASLFLLSINLFAQDSSVSINPALQEIYNSKVPKKYTIAAINVIGTKTFDRNLIISISGLAVGDEVHVDRPRAGVGVGAHGADLQPAFEVRAFFPAPGGGLAERGRCGR